jgi:cell division protein FtsB
MNKTMKADSTQPIATPVRYVDELLQIVDANDEPIADFDLWLDEIAMDGERFGDYVATCINSHAALTQQVADLKSELVETAREQLGVERRCNEGHNKKFTYTLNGIDGCVVCENDRLQQQVAELQAEVARLREERDRLLDQADDLANAISVQSKSDADDIRDQFGERLWKTPDELAGEKHDG